MPVALMFLCRSPYRNEYYLSRKNPIAVSITACNRLERHVVRRGIGETVSEYVNMLY